MDKEKYGNQYVEGFVFEFGKMGDVEITKGVGGKTLRECYVESVLPTMAEKIHSNTDIDLLAERTVKFVDKVLERMEI